VLEKGPARGDAMLREDTRDLFNAYLKDLRARGDYAQHLADDVSIEVVGTSHKAKGREATEQFIRYFHEQVFDADVVPRSSVAGEPGRCRDGLRRHAYWEFAGIPAAGAKVSQPYCVVFDMSDARIVAIRLHLSLPT
jgi:ketosteroid isomerase-like protein